MRDRPQLSVIIPVYNSQNTLVKCLDSVFAQNFPSMEVICVDDGSTDRSSAILGEYQERFESLRIISKKNGGLSSARNAGLEVAVGEFVSFVDSDDYIKPDMFLSMMALFESEIDMALCGTEIDYRSWEHLRKSDEKYYQIRYGLREDILPEMFQKINVNSWNKIFRLDLIRSYNIKFPEGLWYEDAAFFWSFMSVARKISCTPQKFYTYIRYESSIMGKTFRGNSKAIDHLNIAEVVLEFLIKNNQFDRLQESYFSFLRENFELSLKYVPNAEQLKVIAKAKTQLNRYNSLVAVNTKMSLKNEILRKSVYLMWFFYLGKKLKGLTNRI